jgi:hypothetical protein
MLGRGRCYTVVLGAPGGQLEFSLGDKPKV